MMKSILRCRRAASRYLRIFGYVGLYYLFVAKVFKVRWIVPVSKKWSKGRDIFLRLNSSDIPVFDQVFLAEEYGVLDKLPQKDGTILDIGANIGLTSIYLSKKHPEKKIFAIEPDLSNFGLLLLNVSGIANVTPMNFAIWGDRVDSLFIPPGTSEWGRQTRTDKSERLPGS